MAEVNILNKIVSELDFLRKKIEKIEITLNEIDHDLHEVSPAYLKKLDEIKKEGTISKKEFEKRLGVRL